MEWKLIGILFVSQVIHVMDFFRRISERKCQLATSPQYQASRGNGSPYVPSRKCKQVFDEGIVVGKRLFELEKAEADLALRTKGNWQQVGRSMAFHVSQPILHDVGFNIASYDGQIKSIASLAAMLATITHQENTQINWAKKQAPKLMSFPTRTHNSTRKLLQFDNAYTLVYCSFERYCGSLESAFHQAYKLVDVRTIDKQVLVIQNVTRALEVLQCDGWTHDFLT